MKRDKVKLNGISSYLEEFRDKVLPCPCCGNTQLYLGHRSFDEMGVACWKAGKGCGLALNVDIFGVRTLKTGLRNLERTALKVAVMKWNRRP